MLKSIMINGYNQISISSTSTEICLLQIQIEDRRYASLYARGIYHKSPGSQASEYQKQAASITNENK